MVWLMKWQGHGNGNLDLDLVGLRSGAVELVVMDMVVELMVVVVELTAEESRGSNEGCHGL
jgi:hypothetical protein